MAKEKPSIKINYIYNLMYRILTLITPLITAPYISRVLGADNIGIYSFTNANASYFIMFGVFGLSSYSQFECAKKRDNYCEFAQFCIESILARFIMMGISIAVYLCIFIVQWNEYSIYYVILLMSLLSNMLDFSWILEGLEDYQTITIRNFIVKIASVVAVFLFIKEEEHLIRYFIIITLSVLMGNVILVSYVKKYISIDKIVHIKIIPHIKSAMVYFLPSIASRITSTADILMLGWFMKDMTQNGYYEQALKIENMIFMVFASLYLTMRSRMSYLYSTNDFGAIQQYIYKGISAICFLALPICIGLVQISEVFVPWFFGEGYDGVIILLKIMSGWILIKSFSNCLLELLIIDAGEMIKATKIIWVGAILNIIINLGLIPKFGACGAAGASLLTEVVILVVVLKIATEKTNLERIKDNFTKELIAVGLMYFTTLATKMLEMNATMKIITMIVTGIFTYFGATLALRDTMSIEIIKLIKEKVFKYNNI